MCLIPSLSNLHDSVLYYIVDAYFLLVDEVFKTKTLKTNFILFHFEIVLACSCGSIETISSTNRVHMVLGLSNPPFIHISIFY